MGLDDRTKLFASAAFYILALAAQVSGLTNTWVAGFLAIVATLLLIPPFRHYMRKWRDRQRAMGARIVEPEHLLLVGLASSWLSLTVVIAAAGWMVFTGRVAGIAGIVQRTTDEGPLQWQAFPSMEGGPLQARNIFSLTFKGGNASQKEVKLKEASIISAVNGTKLPLEIVAQDELVPVDQIELIPPGAPINLIAKFGAPNPDQPGKVLGLEPKVWLETWRQFFLTVEDNVRTYRIPFNENHLAPFFPGMVGPHVKRKGSAG